MTGAGLRAVVVIPARDEAARVGRCLRALAAQRRLPPGAFEVVLVLDRCTDATAAVARATAVRHGVPLTVVESPGRGVGAARRFGMDLAHARLQAAAAPDGLIACTDADTEVDPRWLAAQLRLVAAGAHAVGGRIELDPAEATALPAGTLARREARARARLRAVRAEDAGAEHHFFSGASMSVTAGAYRVVGGLEPLEAFEDERFARRLAASRLKVVRSDAVRVRTSARTEGRAPRGLAHDLARDSRLAQKDLNGPRIA